MTRFRRATVATVLALSLAACDQKPQTGKLGNDSDRAIKDANRQVDRAAVDARQKMDQAGNVISEKTAEAGKAVDDAVLTAKVKSALIAEPSLNRSLKIDVDASGGAVTLKGVANNNSDREKAVQIASSVEGVRSVKNNLVVVSGS